MSLPSDLTVVVVGSSGRIGSDMARMLEERDIRVLRCDPRDANADLPVCSVQWTMPPGTAVWYLACGPNGSAMGMEEAQADFEAARNTLDLSINAGIFVFADSPWRLRRPLSPYGWTKQTLLSYAHYDYASRCPFISDPIGRYHRDPATIDDLPPNEKFAVVSPDELFERWLRLTEYALGDWQPVSPSLSSP